MTVDTADINRLFLQSLISKQYISDKLIRVLLEKTVEIVKNANHEINVRYSDEMFQDTIANVNSSLTLLGLELRRCINENDGELVWILINVKGDETAQLATQYSTQEIALFKQVIQQIIHAPNEAFSITSLQISREVKNLPIKPAMPASHAETVVESFVARNWLLKSKRLGRYSLSPRTLLELQDYLKQTYEEDIIFCIHCKEILTKGFACYTDCEARVHKHCYRQLKRRANGLKCSQCNSDWQDGRKLHIVGEEVLKEDDSRRTGADASSGRRRQEKRAAPPSNDEEEDEDQRQDDELDEDGPSNSRSRRQATRARQSNGLVDDEARMDVDDEDSDAPATARHRRRR